MAFTILIVCGATASGKSARAIDIARERGGVIINADAMQVYRELRVLTARPTPAQERLVPHRLYGVMEAAQPCSAAHWLALARASIDEARAQNRLPVVTGGTGLYLKTLVEGLSPIPDIPPEARLEAQALWDKEGAEALQARDPVMAARLKGGDTQRQVRALQVWLATGRSLAHWQALPRETPYPEAHFEVEMTALPRDELYRRCDERFLAMLEEGALEEARAMQSLRLPADLPAMRAVGVRELIGFLEGKWSRETAIAKAQQATRNYAKRQMTWFRNQPISASPSPRPRQSAP